MAFSIYITISLIGAVTLGFICAWYLQQDKVAHLNEDITELAADLKDNQVANNRLNAENETRKLSLENLQSLLQNIENQVFNLENEIKVLERENGKLKEQNRELEEDLKHNIREIEVIREIPVLIDRSADEPEMKKENAKKLVKAFRKGLSGSTDKSSPPA